MQYWNDERLAWNASDFDDIDELYVSADSIWTPQLAVLNSEGQVMGDIFSRDFRVEIFPDGSIIWWTAAVIKSTCDLDPTFFPYDNQTCQLSIYR